MDSIMEKNGGAQNGEIGINGKTGAKTYQQVPGSDNINNTNNTMA
jgi:hypothetical protein